MMRLHVRRRLGNGIALGLGTLATALSLVFLLWIVWVTVSRGIQAINLPLFTRLTAHGADGGLANAMVGSLMMDLMAIALCTPVGILAGIWLSECARHSRLGSSIRFLNDILLSAPSIVLGLTVYMLVVRPMASWSGGDLSFSGLAGSIALAMIGLPVIVRGTDEMLQLVPSTLREATLALGVPQWKLTTQVLLRAAGPGILTAVMLALARLAGETAPLLFTAFGNNFMALNPLDKMASLPATIYQYTNDPDPALHAIAWAGALLITLFVLALSLLARAVLSRRSFRHD